MKKFGHLAYNQLPGKSPTVVFLSGFKSDMEGAKALFLEAVCRQSGHAFLRFDYSGHGKSGGKFEDGTIGQWKSDILKIIDQATSGELILVGSSMGGWLMLLAALARPERVKALIGIAAAPDFTEELIWKKFTPAEQKQIAQSGKIIIDNCNPGEEPYPITKKLIEDGRKYLLLTKTPHPALAAGSGKKPPHQVRGVLNIDVPVRLLHGMNDEDVPYQTSQRLAEKLQSKDVEIHLVKSATHRMSEPENLELLKNTLLAIINKMNKKPKKINSRRNPIASALKSPHLKPKVKPNKKNLQAQEQNPETRFIAMKYLFAAALILLTVVQANAAPPIPLPKGWQEMTLADFENTPFYEERKDNLGTSASGDFDGNKKPDIARILKNDNGKEYAIFISLQLDNGEYKHYKLESYAHLNLTAAKNKAAGYYEDGISDLLLATEGGDLEMICVATNTCGPEDNPQKIHVDYDTLTVIEMEKSGWSYYWDKTAKTFKKIWTGC